jgi:hypothetical protein
MVPTIRSKYVRFRNRSDAKKANETINISATITDKGVMLMILVLMKHRIKLKQIAAKSSAKGTSIAALSAIEFFSVVN